MLLDFERIRLKNPIPCKSKYKLDHLDRDELFGQDFVDTWNKNNPMLKREGEVRMSNCDYFIDAVEMEASKKHINVDVVKNLLPGNGGNIRFIFSNGAHHPDYCAEVQAYRMNDDIHTLRDLARKIVLNAVVSCIPHNGARVKGNPSINNVIFNPPATIVFWSDGTKTVVKATGEKYDPEKGLTMAIAKKYFGNEGNYFNQIKKWTEPYIEKTSVKLITTNEPQTFEFVSTDVNADLLGTLVGMTIEGHKMYFKPKNGEAK